MSPLENITLHNMKLQSSIIVDCFIRIETFNFCESVKTFFSLHHLPTHNYVYDIYYCLCYVYICIFICVYIYVYLCVRTFIC